MSGYYGVLAALRELGLIRRNPVSGAEEPAAVAGLGEYEVKAAPGVDCLDSVNAGLAFLRSIGGGTLRFPTIGGVGYYISDMVYVDFSNVTIELCDRIKLTKNTVRQSYGVTNPNTGSPNTPNLFDGVIVFRGRPGDYLTGCSVVAPRRVLVDGNGAAIDAQGSYVHDAFASGNYAAVQMTMCIAPVVRNIETTNSLSFGIQLSYAPGGIVDNSKARNTVHENGIQVAFNKEHYGAVSDTDQTTWGAYRLVDCEAESCKNHGIGSYGAVGVQIVNPKVSNCGNTNGLEQAGPAGGINVEHDGTNTTRNYRVVITNPHVTNSIGFGIRTNCAGTQVSKGNVVGTKKPSNYTESNPTIWGSAVFVQGAGTLETDGLIVDGSERVGYRLQAAGTLYPSLKINGGRVTGCKERAVYGVGFNQVVISRSTEVVNNGNSADANTLQNFTCEFNNAAGNADGGTVDFSGWYYGNQGCVISTSRVGNVILNDVAGGENNANANATAYHSCYIDTCLGMLKVDKVNLSGVNLKQARVVRAVGTHSRIFASPDCVQGFQTGSLLPKFDYAAATISVNVQGSVIYGFETAIGALSVPAASAGVPGTLTRNVTVKGLFVGDIATVSYNKPLQGCLLDAEVSANDTVTVTWRNFGAAVVNYAGTGQLQIRGTRVLGN